MRGADPSPPDAAVNAAARAGDVEKVIALVDAGAAIGAWTTSCAAASGSLALLRERVDHRGCAMADKAAGGAAFMIIQRGGVGVGSGREWKRDLTGSGAKQIAHEVAQVGLSGAHAQEAPFKLHHRLSHLDVHRVLEPETSGRTLILSLFCFFHSR